VVQLISAFKVFDHIQVITDGGPGEGTTASIAFTVLRIGFTANRQGYASAMAIAMLVIIAIASAVALKLLRRREVEPVSELASEPLNTALAPSLRGAA